MNMLVWKLMCTYLNGDRIEVTVPYKGTDLKLIDREDDIYNLFLYCVQKHRAPSTNNVKVSYNLSYRTHCT